MAEPDLSGIGPAGERTGTRVMGLAVDRQGADRRRPAASPGRRYLRTAPSGGCAGMGTRTAAVERASGVGVAPRTAAAAAGTAMTGTRPPVSLLMPNRNNERILDHVLDRLA